MKFTPLKSGTNKNACQIRIPMIYLEKSGITENDKLFVTYQQNKIIIEKIQTKGEQKKND